MMTRKSSHPTPFKKSAGAYAALALTLALAVTTQALPVPHASAGPDKPNGRGYEAEPDWDSYRCGLGWQEPAPPAFEPPGKGASHGGKPSPTPAPPLSSIPEPGSLALLSAGLIGLVGMRLRNRRRED